MKLKQLLALLLAAALLGGVPALAYGEEAPAPDDIFILGESSAYGDIAFGEAPADAGSTMTSRRFATYGAAFSSGGTPSRYDPRESGVTAPIRTQGSWSTCWAIAAMTAAELDGLNSGLLGVSADLSERHLIYFLSHQTDDPLGNSSGDFNTYPDFWVTKGGNPVIATMTLANWHGAADETATASPYSGLSSSDSLDAAYAYTDVLHLENTYALDISTAAGRQTLKSMLLQHGAAVLCLYYSSTYLFSGSPSAQAAQPEDPTDPDDPETPIDVDPDDPVIDAEAAPEDGPLPEEGPQSEDDTQPEEAPPPENDTPPEDEPLPEESPLPEGDVPEAPDADASSDAAGLDGAPEAGELPEDMDDPSDSSEDPDPEDAPETDSAIPREDAPEADGASEADDYTVCYYQNSVSSTSHEVVIVGWDDSYPAENFGYSAGGAVPPGDGAWLCQNSYGEKWAKGDGYFWVSYYDASVSYPSGGTISGRVTVFDFASPDNYENNYEYDGAVVLGYVNDTIDGKGVSTTTAGSSTLRWYANIFTASANGQPRGTEALRAVSTYTYRPGVSYTLSVYTGLTDPADPLSGILAAELSGSFPYAGYHTVPLPESVSLQEGELFSVVFRVGMASDRTLFVPACIVSSPATTANPWYSTNETLAGQSFISMDGSVFIDCKTLKNEPNVRIKAFTDNTDPVFPFRDVGEDAWYHDDVYAAWLGYLVNGTAADTYSPAQPATRAQVVTVLWRLLGQPAPDTAAPFSDVSEGDWYADAVAWAGENGVVNGYADGSFHPNAVISRQDLLTILYRFAARQGMDTSGAADITAYSDSGLVGDWAEDAMAWSLASGLQRGVASGGTVLLDPRGTVTRAQLAAFLNRFTGLS